MVKDDRTGAQLTRFIQPDNTIAFTDAAFPDSRAPEKLIEYSFTEPRFHPQYSNTDSPWRMDPSIHFRHAPNRAVIAWLDGHTDTQTMSFSWSSGVYTPKADDLEIGWFGKEDSNTLFDFDAGGK